MPLVEWMDFEILGNSILLWVLAVGAFLLTWIALVVTRRVLRGRLLRLAKNSDLALVSAAHQVISETRGWFVMLLALFVGSRFLEMQPSIDSMIVKVAIIFLLLQGGLWAVAVLLRLLSEKRARELEENPDAVAAMDVLSFVARLAIWSVVALLVLDNLGINITTLVAGLGVGGIAVALAAQNILGDLFASLSIVLDKPFVVGDFLNIDEHLGSVERVGIKTTRIRSLSGEQLVFSNNDLLSSRIRNYGRMMQRRVVFSVGVTYQTSKAQLEQIPGIIRKAIESQDDARFDRSHFQSYGDFALLFETVYYVLSADYNKYMDIQQAVNLEIYERFAEEGIEFAYPTQTLFVTRSERA
jgi:small-conductance mechanosensitive channel